MKTKLLILLFFIYALSYSQASLVKDIEPGITSSAPNGLTVFNGELYFAATTSASGMELWKSNGTSVGTILLKDINPGASGSAPELLTSMENGSINELHFVADNGIVGRELWQSDGTSVGTELLEDFFVGATGSNISQIIDLSSDVQYVVGDISTNIDYGIETAWVTRQAGGGIIQVREVNTGAIDGNPENLFRLPNDAVYFSGENQSLGKELYVFPTLGQSVPTLISDINPSGDSSPNHFISFNSKIYFSATNGMDGIELFELDPGNGNSVTLLKDINIIGSSNPTEKIVYNNKIYFAADDGVNGIELWESDGTSLGTQMVINLNSGSNSSNPSNFKLYNNRLYFTATNVALGREMFYVNGAGNVINVSNINPGSASSNPSELVEYNGKLYFIADDGSNGIELWETAGTSLSTVMTADINTTGSSNPSGLVVLNDELFFSAFGNSSVSGFELWKYRDPSLSLNSNEISNFTTLYPNPTNGGFVVDLNFPINKIDVYSIQGALVKNFSNEQSIYYIDNLRAGVYFLNIKTDKGTFIKKIIKN